MFSTSFREHFKKRAFSPIIGSSITILISFDIYLCIYLFRNIVYSVSELNGWDIDYVTTHDSIILPNDIGEIAHRTLIFEGGKRDSADKMSFQVFPETSAKQLENLNSSTQKFKNVGAGVRTCWDGCPAILSFSIYVSFSFCFICLSRHPCRCTHAPAS